MGHILPLCETPKCSWISLFLAVDCFWDKWKTLACLIQTKKKLVLKSHLHILDHTYTLIYIAKLIIACEIINIWRSKFIVQYTLSQSINRTWCSRFLLKGAVDKYSKLRKEEIQMKQF